MLTILADVPACTGGGMRMSGRMSAMVVLLLPLQLAAAQPVDPAAEMAAGVEAERDGRAHQAVVHYRRAAEAAPASAAAWAHLGEWWRFHGHSLAEAEACFRTAIAGSASAAMSDDQRMAVAAAWRGLGEVQRHRGDATAAAQAFTHALTAYPLPAAMRSQADLMIGRGDIVGAERMLGISLGIDPDDPIALLQLAGLQVRLGRSEAATTAMQACDIAGVPFLIGAPPPGSHCCVVYNLACFHALSGRRDRAFELLEAFLAIPSHRHLEAAYVRDDRDLVGLRGDPRFTAILARLP